MRLFEIDAFRFAVHGIESDRIRAAEPRDSVTDAEDGSGFHGRQT